MRKIILEIIYTTRYINFEITNSILVLPVSSLWHLLVELCGIYAFRENFVILENMADSNTLAKPKWLYIEQVRWNTCMCTLHRMHTVMQGNIRTSNRNRVYVLIDIVCSNREVFEYFEEEFHINFYFIWIRITYFAATWIQIHQ